MTFTKWPFISLLTLAIGFTTGIFVSPKFFPNVSFKETRKSFNYQFVNPLLECNDETISQDKNLTSVKKSIEYFIDQQKTN